MSCIHQSGLFGPDARREDLVPLQEEVESLRISGDQRMRENGGPNRHYRQAIISGSKRCSRRRPF